MSHSVIRDELVVEDAEFVSRAITETESAEINVYSKSAVDHTELEITARFSTGHNKGVKVELSIEDARQLKNVLDRVIQAHPD